VPSTPEFELLRPTNLGFSWLEAFTVSARRVDGSRADFMAGSEAGEACRRELEAKLDSLAVTWLALEHGAKAVGIPTGMPSQPGTSSFSPQADAAWVCKPGAAVAFTTADCLPIILANEQVRYAAAIHAGWRSLAKGIIAAAFAALPRDVSSVGTFKAWIGPAISAADYEVDTATRRRFLDRDPALAEYFQPTSLGHYQADLKGIAIRDLLANGVAAEDIAVYPGSTFLAVNLHSARRDGAASGRMATLVGIIR